MKGYDWEALISLVSSRSKCVSVKNLGIWILQIFHVLWVSASVGAVFAIGRTVNLGTGNHLIKTSQIVEDRQHSTPAANRNLQDLAVSHQPFREGCSSFGISLLLPQDLSSKFFARDHQSVD